MNRTFHLYFVSLLILACNHNRPAPPPSPPGPGLVIFEWNANQSSGKIKANFKINQEELANPILTHPGTLFVSYSYVAGTGGNDRINGSFQPVLLFAATQPPKIERDMDGSIKEASVSIKQICGEPGYRGNITLPISRLSNPDVRIPPCFVRVEDYNNKHVSLKMASQETHIGDTYLLLLSPFESNPFTQTKTISCTITTTAENDPQMTTPRCMLDTQNPLFQDNGQLYQNRYAVLWKNDSAPNQLPPSSPNTVSSSDPVSSPNPVSSSQNDSFQNLSFSLIKQIEKRAGKIRTNWIIDNVPKEPVSMQQLFAIYSETDDLTTKDQPSTPVGFLMLSSLQKPRICFHKDYTPPKTMDIQYQVQAVSWNEAFQYKTHCFSEVSAENPKILKNKMLAIQLKKGLGSIHHIQTGDEYQLVPRAEQSAPPEKPISCIIKKTGSDSESARCVLTRKLAITTEIQNFYALHSSFFSRKK